MIGIVATYSRRSSDIFFVLSIKCRKLLPQSVLTAICKRNANGSSEMSDSPSRQSNTITIAQSKAGKNVAERISGSPCAR